MSAPINLRECQVQPIDYPIRLGRTLLGFIRPLVDGWHAYDTAHQHLGWFSSLQAASREVVRAALHVNNGSAWLQPMSAGGSDAEAA